MALREELESQGNILFNYRSIWPIGLVVIGFVVSIFSQLSAIENLSFLHAPIYHGLWLSFSLFGLFIRIITVGFTLKNTSGRNTNGQVADAVNMKGIYSTVRHPLYLGNFFMWFGAAMLSYNYWFIIAFCLIYFICYERIMLAEEQFLIRKFGDLYKNWADKRPPFIPKLKLWESTGMTFSWRKVLKSEKNGFFAIFLIYFIFILFSELIIERRLISYEEHKLMIWATIVSAIVYFVLKFLKHKTTVLEEEGR